MNNIQTVTKTVGVLRLKSETNQDQAEKTINDCYDELQVVNKEGRNALKNRIKELVPKNPGPNASPEEKLQYETEMQKFQVLLSAVKVLLEESDKMFNQTLEEITEFYKKIAEELKKGKKKEAKKEMKDFNSKLKNHYNQILEELNNQIKELNNLNTEEPIHQTPSNIYQDLKTGTIEQKITEKSKIFE